MNLRRGNPSPTITTVYKYVIATKKGELVSSFVFDVF